MHDLIIAQKKVVGNLRFDPPSSLLKNELHSVISVALFGGQAKWF